MGPCGVPGAARTLDPMIKSHMLYLLSYRHIFFDKVGFEPTEQIAYASTIIIAYYTSSHTNMRACQLCKFFYYLIDFSLSHNMVSTLTNLKAVHLTPFNHCFLPPQKVILSLSNLTMTPLYQNRYSLQPIGIVAPKLFQLM